MATIAPERLGGCDGFRVESPRGRLGWVEEPWLGPGAEPAALAVRTCDGERRLLVVDAVEAVLDEEHIVVVRQDADLIELDGSRSEAGATSVAAPLERPLWQIVAILYAGIVLLAAVVMAAAFTVAQALA
jgi:hypothetical protein